MLQSTTYLATAEVIEFGIAQSLVLLDAVDAGGSTLEVDSLVAAVVHVIGNNSDVQLSTRLS